jgi:hypothetical protein
MFRKTKLLLRPKWRSLLFLAAAILHGPGFAAGQQDTSCDCTAALVNAIYENRVQRGDHSATVDLASYLCSVSFEDFKKLVTKSGRVDFEIYSLNADTTETEFNQLKTELQKRLQLPETAISSQHLLDKHADLGVWEKWSECRASCDREGVNCWIKNAGYGSFVLYIDYIAPPGAPARMVTLRLVNAESLLQDPMQRQLTPGITTRSIHRTDDNSAAEVKIETVGGNQTFPIQSDLPVPAATPTPIITPTPVPTPTPKATATPAATAPKKSTLTPTKTPRHKRHDTSRE